MELLNNGIFPLNYYTKGVSQINVNSSSSIKEIKNTTDMLLAWSDVEEIVPSFGTVNFLYNQPLFTSAGTPLKSSILHAENTSSFKITTSGIYSISYEVTNTVANSQFQIFVNGSNVTNSASLNSTEIILNLSEGDVVDLRNTSNPALDITLSVVAGINNNSSSSKIIISKT